MSSDPIAKLLVTLGMDSSEFTRGAKRAADDVHTMRNKITAGAAAIKGAIGGMIAAVAVDRLVQVVKSGLDYASSLGEVATQLGLTTRELQEYRYAASQSGIEQGEMDKSLQRLTRTIGQAANGQKAQVALFKEMGISIRDANDNVRDAGDILPEIADHYEKLGSAAERGTLLNKAFGKSGQALAPLMEGGAKGVNNLRQAAHELGIVLSQKQIDQADETADKLSAIKQVLEAKIAGAVADNTDSILELANALIKLVEAAGKAAKAWRYFSNLDWSPSAPSISDQFLQMQVKELGPGVEQTFNPRLIGGLSGGGGPRRAPPKSSPRPPASTPWGPLNTNLNAKRNAIGGSPFGRFDLSNFEVGGGMSNWISAAAGIDGAAASAERAARESFPQLTAATGRLSDELNELRASTQGIMDRLFPEQAQRRAMLDDFATLNQAMNKGQLRATDHQIAVAALRREYMAPFINKGATGMFAAIDRMAEIRASRQGAADSIRTGFGDYRKGLQEMQDDAEEARLRVIDSFAGMVDSSLSHLDRFVNGIRSGNFLDILGGLLNAIDSIAGIATGGQGTKILGMSFGGGGGLPRFANGGSMRLGGLGGVDTNLLSLNGRPIAQTTAGETMTITPANDNRGGGVVVVKVQEGAMFRPIVESTAGRVVSDAAPHIAGAGAAQALSTLGRRQQRSLG